MHSLLLALAWSAHHVLAQISSALIDEQERERGHAFVALLLAVNPSHSLARWPCILRPRMLDDDVFERKPFENPGMFTVETSKTANEFIVQPANSQPVQVHRGSETLIEEPVPENIDTSGAVLVQGSGTLRTWNFADASVDRVQVFLNSAGRPLDTEIDLWQGPDNTPTKLKVYSEDGRIRPFNAVIETPSTPNSIAVRNIASIEYPLRASLVANDVEGPTVDFATTAKIVQGQSLKTFQFPASVRRVEVMLKTDCRPLNARIELISGPNNNKQVIEVYTEDGLRRPFFTILETTGEGNTVRVVNTAPVEFPMHASVVPHYTETRSSVNDPFSVDDKF